MTCTNPVSIRNPQYRPGWSQGTKFIKVPCGSCPSCKQTKINSWVFRLLNEYRSSPYAVFLTLTYDDEHLNYCIDYQFDYPVVNMEEWMAFYSYLDGEPCLVKSHIQQFFRKLRKAGLKFKYYAIGEYGDKGNRPHYHVILFADWDCLNFDYSQFWDKGFFKAGTVNMASIRYVCKHHLVPKNNSPFLLSNLRCGLTDSDYLSLLKRFPGISRNLKEDIYSRLTVFPWVFPGIIVRS